MNSFMNYSQNFCHSQTYQKKRRDIEKERVAKRRARTGSTSKIARTDAAPHAGKHCGGEDHSSRRSRKRPGHIPDINETIFQNLGQSENFTVSLPFKSFIRG